MTKNGKPTKTVPNVISLKTEEEKEVEVIALDGTAQTITIYKDNAEIMELLRDYMDKLLMLRGITRNYQNITRADPLVRRIKETMPWHRDPLSYAKAFYERNASEAFSHAMFLAIFGHPDNVFTEEPTPYKAKRVIPGTEGDLQDPSFNLTYPMERRLKQILDFINAFDKYPEAAEKFTKVMNRFEKYATRLADLMDGIKVPEEVETDVDKDGFQPDPAN